MRVPLPPLAAGLLARPNLTVPDTVFSFSALAHRRQARASSTLLERRGLSTVVAIACHVQHSCIDPRLVKKVLKVSLQSIVAVDRYITVGRCTVRLRFRPRTCCLVFWTGRGRAYQRWRPCSWTSARLLFQVYRAVRWRQFRRLVAHLPD